MTAYISQLALHARIESLAAALSSAHEHNARIWTLCREAWAERDKAIADLGANDEIVGRLERVNDTAREDLAHILGLPNDLHTPALAELVERIRIKLGQNQLTAPL